MNRPKISEMKTLAKEIPKRAIHVYKPSEWPPKPRGVLGWVALLCVLLISSLTLAWWSR